MGIRETLNKNPAITTGATIAIVVLALGAIVWQIFGSSGSSGMGGSVAKQFYSDDDGATYFSDDAKKLAPFDHNGKQAVIARVFKCGSGQPFVGILQRYTKEAKAKMEKAATDKTTMLSEDLDITGIEIKKPKTGDAGWVKQMDPRATQVNRVTCPDGKIDNLEAVVPE